MGKYFTFYESLVEDDFIPQRPDILMRLKKYLKKKGVLNCKDTELEKLWLYYNTNVKNINYTGRSDTELEEFSFWLSVLNLDI